MKRIKISMEFEGSSEFLKESVGLGGLTPEEIIAKAIKESSAEFPILLSNTSTSFARTNSAGGVVRLSAVEVEE